MTPPRLLLATGNAKKGRELAELCAGAFDVLTLKDVGLGDFDVVEDAPDFAGNSRKKAIEVRAALQASGDTHGVVVVVADDSGLCVDALDGHPGVRSARFAADAGFAPAGHSTDASNNRLLVTMLAPIPDERRTARFECHVTAVFMGDDEVLVAHGSVHGRIARDELGGGGFGYDPLFVIHDDGAPNLQGRRMAELTSVEKHAISHRGRAMATLLPRLKARAGV